MRHMADMDIEGIVRATNEDPWRFDSVVSRTVCVGMAPRHSAWIEGMARGMV